MKMTKEEICAMRDKMDETVKIGFDRLHTRFSNAKEMQLEDLCKYADIMKDLSEVQKNVAKARYYDAMHHASSEVL